MIRTRINLIKLDGTNEFIDSAPYNTKDMNVKYGESNIGIWLEDDQGMRRFFHPFNYKEIRSVNIKERV